MLLRSKKLEDFNSSLGRYASVKMLALISSLAKEVCRPSTTMELSLCVPAPVFSIVDFSIALPVMVRSSWLSELAFMSLALIGVVSSISESQLSTRMSFSRTICSLRSLSILVSHISQFLVLP